MTHEEYPKQCIHLFPDTHLSFLTLMLKCRILLSQCANFSAVSKEKVCRSSDVSEFDVGAELMPMSLIRGRGVYLSEELRESSMNQRLQVLVSVDFRECDTYLCLLSFHW